MEQCFTMADYAKGLFPLFERVGKDVIQGGEEQGRSQSAAAGAGVKVFTGGEEAG